jgi:hypothetical protein
MHPHKIISTAREHPIKVLGAISKISASDFHLKIMMLIKNLSISRNRITSIIHNPRWI